MARGDLGSLTKEPPLAKLDATIRAIRPGMHYSSLLAYARSHTHRDAPGLIRRRYLLVADDNTIKYDYFLSLIRNQNIDSLFIRKIMYFLWAYRDDRLRRFVCEAVASPSGRWRVSELIDKRNSKFFEEWLRPSTARKARSNFEYFLVEAKIFDQGSLTIHLDLEDGWLEHACIAAAQHERDPVFREELLASPTTFLQSRGWLGLLNISRSNLVPVSPILRTESAPFEDELITARPATTPVGIDWNRSSPAFSGRATTAMKIDLVARERASKSHHSLERALAKLAKTCGFAPKYNQNIDIYFETPHGTVLSEVKSATDINFHSQVRKGISQIFEYRFLYQNLFEEKVTMLLVMECKPPREKQWLVDYVGSLGITLAWKLSDEDLIVTTREIPKALLGIVTPVKF